MWHVIYFNLDTIFFVDGLYTIPSFGVDLALVWLGSGVYICLIQHFNVLNGPVIFVSLSTVFPPILYIHAVSAP